MKSDYEIIEKENQEIEREEKNLRYFRQIDSYGLMYVHCVTFSYLAAFCYGNELFFKGIWESGKSIRNRESQI